MRTLALLALMLLAAVPAHADTLLYTYPGLPYQMVTGAYTTSDYVRGWFTLDAAFVPPGFDGVGGANYWNFTGGVRDWSFTDGHQTLTPATTTAVSVGLAMPSPEGRGHPDVFGHPTPGQTVDVAYFVSLQGLNGFASIETYLTGHESGDAGRLQGVGSGTCWPNPMAYGCQAVVDDQVPGGLRWWGSWTVETVSVPELAILPRLPRVLKFGLGLGVEAKITNALQRATAWTAAKILGTHHDGIYIDMPRVRVEVAEACSGLQTLLLMLAAAGLVGLVQRGLGLGGLALLVLAAIVLALEANALRVAGIALGLEHLGTMSREWKDWVQIGTTGIAVGQLVGIGRLVTRR